MSVTLYKFLWSSTLRFFHHFAASFYGRSRRSKYHSTRVQLQLFIFYDHFHIHFYRTLTPLSCVSTQNIFKTFKTNTPSQLGGCEKFFPVEKLFDTFKVPALLIHIREEWRGRFCRNCAIWIFQWDSQTIKSRINVDCSLCGRLTASASVWMTMHNTDSLFSFNNVNFR